MCGCIWRDYPLDVEVDFLHELPLRPGHHLPTANTCINCLRMPVLKKCEDSRKLRTETLKTLVKMNGEETIEDHDDQRQEKEAHKGEHVVEGLLPVLDKASMGGALGEVLRDCDGHINGAPTHTCTTNATNLYTLRMWFDFETELRPNFRLTRRAMHSLQRLLQRE
ncbi:hypothetical protein FQN60_014063 [Etheostoma spectabile]|uniref:Uncharacterized protein n=1 Tax=Etheostoma spectabile TaxID=54343 RepID=A0A5J5D9G5_9PERO|nr:hypothetical protein FQN60_014063 [Etheostoma spectabile]